MASSGERKKGGISQSIGLSAIATAFAHPLAYVKVLIQVCMVLYVSFVYGVERDADFLKAFHIQSRPRSR